MKELLNHIAVLFFFLSGVGFWLWQIARLGYALAMYESVPVWRDGQFQQSEHEADGITVQPWVMRGRE